MRTRRYSSIHVGLTLATAVAVSGPLACSSGDGKSNPATSSEEEGAKQFGTMSMALTARGASGSLYRLRQAVFDVFRSGAGPVRPPIAVPPFIDEPGPPIFVEPDPVGIDERPPPIGVGGAFVSPPIGEAGTGNVPGPGGNPGAGGSPGSGGFAGSGSAGSAGTVGSAGSFPIPPDPGDFFATTLFSEDNPTASTLEATLPTGSFQITLFDGWFLEKIIDGEPTRVEARLASPSFQQFSIAANDETQVVYRFETNGEIIEFAQGRLVVSIEVDEREDLGEGARRSVMETNLGALAGLTLRDTLDAALRNSGASASEVTALDAYHAIIDSYAPSEEGRDPGAAHCDDEVTDGAPSLNGYPLQCGRLEAQQFDNLDSWQALAFVNRLDLAPADGANCGQQRIIFSNNSPIGNGRMFIILEAVVPNPTPECGVAACRPIAEFWSSQVEIDDGVSRGERLRDAFLNGGIPGFAPFMNSDQMGPNGGQVRTNNFNDFIWTLREFHFQPAPAVLPLPQPVAESPFGGLWNDALNLPAGDACRESFLAAAGGLLGSNLAAMSFPVAQACKDAESANDFRQDYVGHLASGTGEFLAQLEEVAAPAGLTGFDIAARARFVGSCMGCHQEASGSSLGGGLFAPFQSDFVQVSEFGIEDCGDGESCFGISSALRDVFLPHRLNVQTEFLEDAGTCGSGGGGSGGSGSVGGAPGELPPPIIEGNPSPGQPRLTLGGQLATPHGH